MKRKISFTDRKHNRVNLEIEIENGRFSISGDMGGSAGQIQDHISPKNSAQRKLIDLWERWHLNDMHAGTEEQEACLKKAESPQNEQERRLDHYGWAKGVLKAAGILATADGYTYGTSWLKRDLPADIEDQVNSVCDAILAAEAKAKKAKEEASPDVEDEEAATAIEDPKIRALIKHLSLTVADAEDIENTSGNHYTAQGIDYLVCTDKEADEETSESLDNYIDECVLCEIKDDNLKRYFNRESFKEDAIASDGRGNTLNRWDGEEEEVELDDETYYIYRQ